MKTVYTLRLRLQQLATMLQQAQACTDSLVQELTGLRRQLSAATQRGDRLIAKRSDPRRGKPLSAAHKAAVSAALRRRGVNWAAVAKRNATIAAKKAAAAVQVGTL